jgi:recombination protein RecA
MGRGRPKGSKNKKLVPLSEESLKKVEKGLKEAGEGKIERIDLDKELKKEEPILTPEQKERREKLHRVMGDINKDIKGADINFANTYPIRERQSFGYKCLDKLTNGGIPRGLFSTIWGSKGCSKTTIAIKMVAAAQREGKLVAWIDAEHSYDKEWAFKFGVIQEELAYERPETAEGALDTIIRLVREQVVDLIVLDSIHSLCPKGQLYEGKTDTIKSTGKDTQALRARKLTQFFEMSIDAVSKAKCAVLLIAQSREEIGEFFKIEKLTGGHALLHNSRIIMRVRRGQGVDCPSEIIITDKPKKDKEGNILKDKKGNIKYETETKKLGFDLVAHIDKSQVQGCTELSEIHVPFYFKEGIKEE